MAAFADTGILGLIPHPCQINPLSRPMFSASYLRLDKFTHSLEGRKARVAKVGDVDRFVQRFKQSFEDKGLGDLFLTDIEKFECCVDTKADLELLARVTKAIFTDDTAREIPKRNPRFAHKQVLGFFRLCFLMDDVEAARSLWTDPEFESRGWKEAQHFRVHTLYYTHLFRSQRYQELVDELLPKLLSGEVGPTAAATEAPATAATETPAMGVEMSEGANFTAPAEEAAISDNPHHRNLAEKEQMMTLLFVMAALAKLQTPESLATARRVFDDAVKRHGYLGKGRPRTMLAWLLHQLGHYAQAYDLIIGRYGARRKNPASQLAISVLTKSGRLESAFDLIREDFLWGSAGGDAEGRRPFLCQDVMTELANEVVNAADQKLSHEFSVICQELDQKADLHDSTLESVIFAPITETSRRIEKEPKKSNRDSRKKKERSREKSSR